MNRGHIIYIDGCSYTHKNIAGFINSSKGKDPTIRPNFQFVEVINNKDGDMEREVDRLIMVEAIMDPTIGDKLLILPLLKKHSYVKEKGRRRSPYGCS